MTAMPDPTATRNSAAEISRPPGGEIEPLQYPCNLAAASSEPENVMPPISTSRTVAVAVPADIARVVVVVGDGDKGGSSATDRVEQADELRHRRHGNRAG